MISESLRQALFEEAAELLTELESGVFHLEDCPGDSKPSSHLLLRALREGQQRLMGLHDVARFAHAVGDLLNALFRKGVGP